MLSNRQPRGGAIATATKTPWIYLAAVIPANQEVVVSAPTQGANGRAYRLASVDMLRGLVIVVMAIDHVRDYFNFGGEAGSDGQSRHRRRALLHALDHAFLRTGVRVPRGHKRRLDDVAQDAVSVGRVPVQARRVADLHRVVCRCHRLELCAVGNRAARWARRRCDAGDLGHRREHGRPGGRAVPWTARVSHHRRRDPGWSQSARSDLAGHERRLRHRPSIVGGVARPDGNREWTVLFLAWCIRCCHGPA